MSRRKRGDASDEALFREAMRGVRRLEHDRVVTRRPRPSRPRVAEDDDSVPIAAATDTMHAEHARRSVPQRTLARLRRGRLRPERTLDLHGMRLHEAETAVEHGLARARRDGVRCLLLIHGIGRGRVGGGVLRSALPGWLERHPAVLATSPAIPADGGAGASYVLLRRGRDRR